MSLASSLALSGTLVHTCPLSLIGGHPFCGPSGTFSCSKQLAHLCNGRLRLIIPPLRRAPEWNYIDPRKKEELDKRAEDGEFW